MFTELLALAAYALTPFLVALGFFLTAMRLFVNRISPQPNYDFSYWRRR